MGLLDFLNLGGSQGAGAAGGGMDIGSLMSNPAFTGGMGLLAASQGQAGQGRPSLGQGIGGFMQGASAAQDYQTQALKAKMLKQSFDDEQRKRQALYGTPWTNPDTGQTDQYAGGLLGQLPPDQRAMAAVAPDEFLKYKAAAMFPKPGADTDPVQNAKFLFPNDPQKQAQYVYRVTTQAKENQTPQINLAGKWQVVQTSSGFMRVNTATGEVQPISGETGHPLLGVTADPSLTGAKAEAAAHGTATGTAASTLPTVEQASKQITDAIDGVRNAPGKKYSLGLYSAAPTIPGTAQADFRARLDQLKGQTFLQAYNSLKGGGQITEIEGQKATDALARLNMAQSEAGFDKALDDFESTVRQLTETARRRAAGGGSSSLKSKYGLE